MFSCFPASEDFEKTGGASHDCGNTGGKGPLNFHTSGGRALKQGV